MSVLGLGLDVVDVERFAEQLADPASGFVDGTFTAGEQADASFGSGDRTLRLAGRFAAKEAFIKAWSAARFGRPPALPSVDLRSIELRSDGHGRPAIALHGEVAEEISSLAIQLELRGEIVTHVSLSHDGGVAAAVVVLSARPVAF
ncbi:MAG: holo-ACP synthase [Solirubrobacteraceae bacterium]|nr:holo-ACP synthase [Solirubrobacteraceae bacterium]